MNKILVAAIGLIVFVFALKHFGFLQSSNINDRIAYWEDALSKSKEVTSGATKEDVQSFATAHGMKFECQPEDKYNIGTRQTCALIDSKSHGGSKVHPAVVNVYFHFVDGPLKDYKVESCLSELCRA